MYTCEARNPRFAVASGKINQTSYVYVSRTNLIQSESRERMRMRRVFVSPPAFINRMHLHSGALRATVGIIFPIRCKHTGRIFSKEIWEIGRVCPPLGDTFDPRTISPRLYRIARIFRGKFSFAIKELIRNFATRRRNERREIFFFPRNREKNSSYLILITLSLMFVV